MSTRFFSESQVLRLCNLPSSPKWRAFVRERLGGEQVAGAVVYERCDAEALAHQIAGFAAEVIPITEERPANRRVSKPAKLTDRRGPTVSI